MKKRLIILSIDDINNLFRDYARMTGYPEDAICDTLLMNQATKKMRLRIESPALSEHEAPELIRFDLQRTYSFN
jgi:hypothetical protein